MQASEFLKDLRREIEHHPAVNHVFLMRVGTTPFTREDYRVFGLNHYPLVGTFCRYMEHLLLNAPDSDSKSWIAKVLVDEYGEGSDGEDHAQLYRKFLTACGVGPGEEDEEPLDPRVVEFIREHLRLVTEEPFLVGLGALGPGHEWAIPKMFVPIIDGLRRAGFDEREILYFTLHTLQDQDHGRWLEEALSIVVRTPEDAAQVRRGALLSMQARMRFWDGVQARVVRWRQPVHMWDIPERVRLWAARHQPTIAQVAPSLGVKLAAYRPQVRKYAGLEA
ncbi:MAG: iron-containing redox enzyme family protein [Deltaproteobacteria bacterium]|nr:iron-containing redox enzyme family protein [Deltaproteobacteria bacterium]